MSSTTAYMCDGPGCEVLTARVAGTTYPADWLRATVRLPGGLPVTGAFHAPECALAWQAERTKEEPEAETP